MIELLLANISGEWIQQMRDHESQQNRPPIEDVINSSLEDFNDGCNGSTKQEELLQLPCDKDKESLRWGHDRCDNRPGLRPRKDREGENCWSRHSREEDEGFGGEGTWIRCDELDEGKVKRDH